MGETLLGENPHVSAAAPFERDAVRVGDADAPNVVAADAVGRQGAGQRLTLVGNPLPGGVESLKVDIVAVVVSHGVQRDCDIVIADERCVAVTEGVENANGRLADGGGAVDDLPVLPVAAGDRDLLVVKPSMISAPAPAWARVG
jgi:hypothetical protein